MRRLTAPLLTLRAIGVVALLLLLWNPATMRTAPAAAPPLILLDASLSMGGQGGAWRAALDTARAIATHDGVIWRFGSDVRAFDTTAAREGSSRLAPALATAAARGGEIVIISDGELQDVNDLPPDLRRRARVIVLPRRPFHDAYMASVTGPHRLSAGDTLALQVIVGVAGPRDPAAARRPVLAVYAGDRRLVATPIQLPDSGTRSVNLSLPTARILPNGWSALDVRLEGVDDMEPRDDARSFVVEVAAVPGAVVLASPPDWESRFLARSLADVAQVPVKSYVETEPGRWRDGATLAPVSLDQVARAVSAAKLVAVVGDPRRAASFRIRGSVLTWPTQTGHEGDWYVDVAPPSPLAERLSGVAWDSLPPLLALGDAPPDSAGFAVLTARLSRRGAPRSLAVVSEAPKGQGSGRRASILGSGLWRWGFRGGASAEAYRALIAALSEWLLGGAGMNVERVMPVATEVANGLPLRWRWTGKGPARDSPITLTRPGGSRVDTLRFDARGFAELSVPPGNYRYSLGGGEESGLVAVEQYSDEWRPAPVVLRSQPGETAQQRESVPLRERWWLFALAIAAFAAEWTWRRRIGLP